LTPAGGPARAAFLLLPNFILHPSEGCPPLRQITPPPWRELTHYQQRTSPTTRRVGVGVTSHPSHRSGRAQLRHPARRTTDSLRPLGYPLVVREHGVPVRKPARVSLQRPRSPAPPSLDRVPAAAVPRLPRYYEALRFPTNLHDGLPCRSPVVTTRWAYGGVAGRPKFLGNPLVPMPCSRTPAGPEPPGRRVGGRGPRNGARAGYPWGR